MREDQMTSTISKAAISPEPKVGIPPDAGERYRRDGFFFSPPIIPTDLISRVTASMDAVMAGEYETGEPPRRSWNPGDDPKCIRKIDQAHLSDRTIYELASHPAIGHWASVLLGAKRVQLWASQMLYKPPAGPDGGVTGNVGWHQDKQYWRYLEGELFTAWVAVSDVTAASGPMRFLRGSHRWGLLDSGDFFGHDHEAQRKDIPVPEGESWVEVEAVLPPGAVSFHDRHTYHASGPNVSNAPRRSFAFHLRTENTRPVEGRNDYYLQHLDDPAYCPVLYEA
ncbi:MAG: phytanoyl-CoA dioxygenase family protein [Gemmatimonadetes bacterium]|nr:phytanoyl-CoA dioxygenase family protein [Gemmatimonadota bacterium]MYB60123.1 phytanoyl-CoA dioxygenase family protein [Gemmatimonadota bacterium]